MPIESPNLGKYTSCVPKEPLIKLDPLGSAPILRYTLPQETCLDSKAAILLVNDATLFKAEFTKVPEDDYFRFIDTLTPQQAESLILASLKPQNGNPLILNANLLRGGFQAVVKKPSATKQLGVAGAQGQIKRPGAGSAVYAKPATDDDDELHIGGEKLSDMVTQVVAGKRPVAHKTPYGNVCIKYMSRPTKLVPRIYMVEHYKTCNFLGDYGAGKVVKTFSLLPGEKTTISVRSFKKTEEFRKRSENVIDSMSEDSMNELQNTIETETNNNSGYNTASTDSSSFGIGVDVSAKFGPVKAGVDIDYSSSSSDSVNTTRAESVNALNSAINKQVSQSNQSREISVNTETSSTTTTENEDSTVREISNKNYSRVLNFVYRQLLQDWYSITYLNEVTFVFDNGYPEHTRVAKLSGLNTLLSEVIELTTDVDSIRNSIYTELCNVFDYTGTPQKFIEKKEYTLSNCVEATSGPNLTFVRKNSLLAMPYLDQTIHGVILKVNHHTLRTDSLVCDAFLGQGEALDCFNQRLQDEEGRKAWLTNEKLVRSINFMESVGSRDLTNASTSLISATGNIMRDLQNECCATTSPGGCNCYSCSDKKEDNGGGIITPPPVSEKPYGALDFRFTEFPDEGGSITLDGILSITGPSPNGNVMDGFTTNIAVTLAGTIASGGPLTILSGTGTGVNDSGETITINYEVMPVDVPTDGRESKFKFKAELTATPTSGPSYVIKIGGVLNGNLPFDDGGNLELLGKYWVE